MYSWVALSIIYSHCCTNISTIHLLNFFIISYWTHYTVFSLSHSPSPGNWWSTWYEFDLFPSTSWVESYSSCIFVYGLFHLAYVIGVHVMTCTRIYLFLRLNNLPLSMCVLIPHFDYQLIYWLETLLVSTLAVVYNVAMNMGIQVTVWILTLISFGYIPMWTCWDRYSNSIFNFLRNQCTIFQTAAPFYIFISTQGFQFLYILINTCRFLFCFPLITLIGVKWCLIVILICISVISDVEHLLICSLSSCVSSVEKWLFKSLAC